MQIAAVFYWNQDWETGSDREKSNDPKKLLANQVLKPKAKGLINQQKIEVICFYPSCHDCFSNTYK